MKNSVFPRMGGSGLPSYFASCPPPFGLLLYLRKAPRHIALAVGVLGQLCKTTYVALNVCVCRSEVKEEAAGRGT